MSRILPGRRGPATVTTTATPEGVPGPRRARRGWQGAGLAALLVSSLVMAACSPTPALPSKTTVGPTAGGGSGNGAYGDYAGSSSDSSATITFTAASRGITKVQGSVMLVCAQGNGSSLTYVVNSTIPLNGMSFSSDTTSQLSGSTSEEVNVAGTLDGSGKSSGTLSFKLKSGGSDICDSGNTPIDWKASIGGSTTPTTAASSSSCTPAPCATSNGVTVSVTGLQNVSDPSSSSSNVALAVKFTVTNDTSADFLIQTGYFTVQPGSGQAVNPPLNAFSMPDGTSCEPAGDLPPGSHSDPQCLSAILTAAQAAEPLKLRWSFRWNGGGADGIVDLAGVAIQ